jgi:hypothetical protein
MRRLRAGVFRSSGTKLIARTHYSHKANSPEFIGPHFLGHIVKAEANQNHRNRGTEPVYYVCEPNDHAGNLAWQAGLADLPVAYFQLELIGN